MAAALEGADSGLVGWWKFDEGSGATAGDSAGGNTGTLLVGTLPVWTSGQIGGALRFGDVSNKVSVQDSPSLNLTSSNFTISFWMNWSGYVAGMAILGKNGTGFGYKIGVTSNSTLGFTSYQNGSYQIVRTRTPDISGTNKWNHVVFTKEGSVGTFYVNGVEASAYYNRDAIIDPASSAGTALVIGGAGASTNYSGLLDDVRIYNRAISQQEISDLYNYAGAITLPPVFTPPNDPIPIVPSENLTPAQNVVGPSDGIFYVDPDFSGSIQNGSETNPWTSLNQSSQWDLINKALEHGPVTVYFSARDANTDTEEQMNTTLSILRTNTSSNRLTLDGMQKYNTNDVNPSWQDYNGSRRFAIYADYPINTGNQKRNYITIRGFKTTGGVVGKGGQSIYYFGGDHIIIENNEITHSSNSTHGAALQFHYAHYLKDGIDVGNGGSTDINIRNNIIHDTFGEAIYIGGSENQVLPAHSNITIENNTIYNAGRYGGQGDCIDIKDGLTNVIVRGNICHDNQSGDNVNGIVTMSPALIERNVVYNTPGIGISLGTYWGSGFTGAIVRKNLIFNNTKDGLKISSEAVKPIKNTIVDHNTIVGNLNGINIGSNSTGAIQGITIKNNIVANNVNGGIIGWGSLDSVLFSYNDFFGQKTNYVSPFKNQTGFNGNISANPLFLDSSKPYGSDNTFWTVDDGLGLQSNSPAIKAGGSGSDLGAYEYVNGGITAPPVVSPPITPPATSIIGDFNSDGIVNSIDLSLMITTWNTNNTTYDLNRDGRVNSLDYVVMVRNWTM